MDVFRRGLGPYRTMPSRIKFCLRDSRDEFEVVPRIAAIFCANTTGSSGSSRLSDATVAAVWAGNLSSRWGALLSALLAQNSQGVFQLFSGMFREEFIWGLTYGNEVDRWPHRRPFLALNILGALVEMAEAIGIARTETPEQGVPYWELQKGADQLVVEIERAIGIEIGFPQISAAYGVQVGGSLFIQGQLAHIYSAWKLKCYADQFFGEHHLLNIVEIGGGYGGLCYWFHKMCSQQIATYTIVDLPSTNAVQAYFLSRALGASNAIALYNCEQKTFDTGASIRLVPHMEIGQITERIDIVINQDSFPELPETEVDRYLEWIVEKASYFMSLNQEAYSPVAGVPQVLVSDRCMRQSRLERIVRNRSWVRNGYVEEIYRVTSCDVLV